jgi:hypothetical protein
MVRCPWALLVMAGQEFAKFEKKEVTATYRAQLDKSRLLRQVLPMIFLGSIPRDGIDCTQVYKHTHGEFAAAMGYTWTESYTRNARKAPKFVKRQMRQLVKGAVYRFVFQGAKPNPIYGPNDFTMSSAKELREDKEWQKYWRTVRGEYSGYTQMPAWLLDPRTPGTPYEKLALVALASFGLFTLDANGHCKGELQKELAAIASRVGLSPDAIRSALATYQELKLLQVKVHPVRYVLHGKVVGGWMVDGEPVACHGGSAHPKRAKEKLADGAICPRCGAAWKEPPEGAALRQPPNTIYYVAGREFSEDKAAAEMARFLAAGQPVRDNPWFDQAVALHAAVMREWIGTRQLERTLHAESKARMLKAHVPGWMIDLLFRRKPPG